MIKHIVMWKLKENAEGKTKEENAEIIKNGLEGLKEKLDFDIDENDFSVCNLGFMYIYQHGDVFIVCYNYFERQQQFVVVISYFDGSPDILYADYLEREN